MWIGFIWLRIKAVMESFNNDNDNLASKTDRVRIPLGEWIYSVPSIFAGGAFQDLPRIAKICE
jgi:hypothetical protein